MKCGICSTGMQTTFLGKIIGTHIKDEKGKVYMVCFECQKKFPTKQEMLAKLS
jgi:hypothetical protein